MLLHHETAERVFRKIVQAQEEIRQYVLSPGRRDLPVEEFQRVIGQMYNIQIIKEQVPFEGEYLRGMLLRFSDRALIVVKKNMEEDWKRFVAVKELCHVMIDEQEHWSTSGTQTIRKLVFDYARVEEKLASSSTQSETFAEIAAIELLFPFSERQSERKAVERATNAQLSNMYKIPSVIVVWALSDEHDHLCSQSWQLLD